jgi:hypothetical protein
MRTKGSRILRKAVWFALLGLAVLFGLPRRPSFVPVANAEQSDAQASSGCSLATLNGTYGFRLFGMEGSGSGPWLDAVGTLAFDGAGNVTMTYTQDGGGGGPLSVGPNDGSYALGSDCTGSTTVPNVGTYNVVALSLDEVLLVQTDPASSVMTADAVKIRPHGK